MMLASERYAYKGLHTLIYFSFSAVPLGSLSGWLTGQAGHEATVTAAVVPAIISFGGGLFLANNAEKDKDIAFGTVIFIVVFCLCFFAFVNFGFESRNAYERAALIESKETRLRLIDKCTRAERLMNLKRESIGLEKLDIEYICGKI